MRGDLGKDGDAALALEIVGIHCPFGNLLIFAKGAGLGEEPVDQGGLAVIDMGNDGNVAQIHSGPIAFLRFFQASVAGRERRRAARVRSLSALRRMKPAASFWS